MCLPNIIFLIALHFARNYMIFDGIRGVMNAPQDLRFDQSLWIWFSTTDKMIKIKLKLTFPTHASALHVQLYWKFINEKHCVTRFLTNDRKLALVFQHYHFAPFVTLLSCQHILYGNWQWLIKEQWACSDLGVKFMFCLLPELFVWNFCSYCGLNF